MSERSVYVTYIRTTREQLWESLHDPQFVRAYGCVTWGEDVHAADGAEISEAEHPRRLVLTWRNASRPESYARAIFELEQQGDTVAITATHERVRAQPKRLEDLLDAWWPQVLAGLKNFIETGQPRKTRGGMIQGA